MAIKVSVGDPQPSPAPAIEEEPKAPQASMQMNARKNLDGSLGIYDHIDIDIVVMPKKNKILALAKNEMSDDVYHTQSRLFAFLVKRGVVLPESVKGGNVYGSLEGSYPPSEKGKNHAQISVYTIGKFLEEEKPYYMWSKAHDENMEDYWTEPDSETSTELGEVPQSSTKGSIPKGSERVHGYKVYE